MTFAPDAGVDVDDLAPFGVCSTVTVNVLPGVITAGGVEVAVRTTDCANRFGLAIPPALKPVLGFITKNAGEVEAEYCEI